VTRRGSRWSLRLGFALYPTLLLPLALAPSLAWLALTLTGWAAANSVVDVAMNAAGTEAQAGAHKPLLSRMHAGQSAGLLAGGLAATGAAAARVSLPVHFAAAAAVAAAAGLAATTRLPPGVTDRRSPALTRPGRRQALLGAVAFCGFLIDGSTGTWAAVDLRAVHHAPAATAAAAYTCFTVAMGAGRAGGDRAVARFGRARVVQGSGLTAAAGGVLVIVAPTAMAALAGWVIIGAGVAMLAPTVLGAAPATSGAATAGNAIAAVTTLGYLGSFTGAPLIGALASLATLPAALGLLPGAATAAVLLAPAALPVAAPRHRGSAASPGKSRSDIQPRCLCVVVRGNRGLAVDNEDGW
jgi:hypothetical protein